MNNILIDKFGPRLKGIATLLSQFQENLYYIYDCKKLIPKFKSSTDKLLTMLLGSNDDSEDAVFENLSQDVALVETYLNEWESLVENEVYRNAIILMQSLLQEMKSLEVAWNIQSETEKRELLSSMRRQSRL